MRMIQILLAVGVVVLLASILWAMNTASLVADLRVMTDLSWGAVTLIDLYLGLLVFAGWAVYCEKGKAARIAWPISFMLLGNLAVGIYVIWRFQLALRANNVAVFFQGHRAFPQELPPRRRKHR